MGQALSQSLLFLLSCQQFSLKKYKIMIDCQQLSCMIIMGLGFFPVRLSCRGTIRRKKKPNRNQNFSDGEVSHGERSVHDAAYCTYRVLTNVFM